MSEDSAQLSVAELLARNGQDVPSGGGRRRRGGRGISVNELTGDLPAVREGSSAHAAPDPDAENDATAQPPGYAAAEPSGYPEPEAPRAPDGPPRTSLLSGPDAGPAYSPQSGPISFYDPLGTHGVQGDDSQGGYAPASPPPRSP